MAEQVQAALDQMVAPLADLMDRMIFSQSEIHAIVARRRESEYLLRRRNPRKADYISYIQDELKLEKLRQLRTKKQQAEERERLRKLRRLDELQKKQTGKKKNLGDPHIVQNIHLLFRRVLRKYKEDVSLYLQYADVCKDLQSFSKLPQVYAEAVLLHPHCTGLWIEAASHEFFHRQSISAARILLQRALRINPTAKDLWCQSFALEFHYIAKMQGRKTLLLEAAEADAEKTEALNPNIYAIAKIVYEGAIKAIPDDVSFRLQFFDLCLHFPYTETMEGHIFNTIRRDFKDSPKAWIARATQLLEQKNNNARGDDPKGFAVAPIRQEDEEKQEDDADDWESKEDSGSDDSDSSSDDSDKSDSDERPTKKQRTDDAASPPPDDPVLAMIQKAIKAVESSGMYLESVRFLWMYWEKVDGEEATQQKILHFLKELLDTAASYPKIYNVPLAMEHAEFYTRVDQVERAREILTEFKDSSLENKRDDIRLTPVWLQLAGLTFQMEPTTAAYDVLKEALARTSVSDPDHFRLLLHLLGVELIIASESAGANHQKRATATFQKILLLDVGLDDDEDSKQVETSFGIKTVEQACWQFLLHMIDSSGPINGVRKTCKLVLHQSNFIDRQNAGNMQDVETLVGFFDKVLELEIENLKSAPNRSKTERKKDKLSIRQLFDAAIRVFKDIPSLASKFHQQRLEASLL